MVKSRTSAAVVPHYLTAKAANGAVSVMVSATGPVSAAQSIPLTFPQSGKVTEIDVAPGQKVQTGQVLAKQDTTTLEAALNQAKAQLAQQQAALEKLDAGPTPAQVAADKQVIAAAEQNLKNAQANSPLVEQQNQKDAQTYTVALANAQNMLADAQANYGVVQQQVQKSLQVDQLAIDNAQQVLQNAQKNQAVAEQQINVALQSDQTAVQNAQQAVQAAEQNLQNAQAIVQSGTPVEQQQLAQAKNALYTAQVARDNACGSNAPTAATSCNTAQANVNTQETAVNTVMAQIAQSQAQARQQLATAQQALATAKGNLQTVINAANADRAKQAAASLSAQQAVDSAQAALKTVQMTLQNDQAKAQGQVQAARQAIDSASASVRTAQASLADEQTKAASAVQAAQQQIDTAQQAVKTAQANLAILTSPPTQADIDSAKAAVANAQVAVNTAQTNLDNATLRAPIDATVAEVNGTVGQIISGGASASSSSGFILLSTLNALQVVAQVNEADMAKITLGDPVNFTLDAFPNDTFTGKVAIIQPVGVTSQNIVNYNVTSTINPTPVKLLPGMTANVNIIVQQAKNVLTIPSTALTFAQSYLQQSAANRSGGAPNVISRAGSNTANAAASSRSVAGGAAAQRPAGNRTGNFRGGQSATGGARQSAHGSTSQAPVVILVNGKPSVKVIEAGLNDGTNVQVISGLNAGDEVVTGAGISSPSDRTNGQQQGSPRRFFGGGLGG
ncbi:MAG: biotin/lipoyl-binding protein [Chloroflexi bacterium]|nr:biotin/lipoyl-binding protein [Chloroflexota bacterium]